MSDPSNEYGNVLQKVHQLGSATESLFSRLYQGLNRRSVIAEKEAALKVMSEQAQTQIIRARQLRNMLKERDIEVERLNGILEHISEGIIMQDTEGRIALMNKAALDILGNQHNFWKTELGTVFNEQKDIQPIGPELAPLGEVKRVTIGQRVIGAQIAALTTEQGDRLGTIMILSDVTQDELANRIKNSFVTHISHELITPLAPMRVASEVLLNTPEDQAPNRRMLELVGKNIDILDRLVTEMLDMSAMTSGNFQIQHDPIAVEDVLWSVVDSFQADVQDAGLDIAMMVRDASQLNLRGDRKHLHWALTNLVRNAIVYNESGQHIVVRAKLTRENIIIAVEDTGVGIAESDLPHIFKLFYRGEPRTPAGKRIDPRGLGQGLYVARTIAEAHGGSLDVQSQVGAGSTFTITLPQNIQLPA